MRVVSNAYLDFDARRGDWQATKADLKS